MKLEFRPFQSPRSGRICSNRSEKDSSIQKRMSFQSPRSGQICSNDVLRTAYRGMLARCFNPLDRVKFVQMTSQEKLHKLKSVSIP